MARSLFQASALVSLALLLSRFSGLIREQVLGARLGLSAQMDAALLILTLPDLLVGLLLSGGFAAALVPALTRANPDARMALTRRIMAWTGLVALALGAALFAGMPLVLGFLAPTTDVDTLSAFRVGFALSLVALPVAAMIGVSSSYLNATGKYSVPALTVLAFNGVLAVYFYLALGGGAVNFTAFGFAVLAAMCLRFGLQLVQMGGFARPAPKDAGAAGFDPGFYRQFIQGVLGASLVVAMPIVFRSLYALGGAGELAEFNYALRIFELPMGILIAPITVIFLPLLSELKPGEALFAARAALALRTALMLGLTGALVGIIYAEPITTLLFGFGEMAGAGTQTISATLRVMLIALPFMALFQALGTALNASHRTGHVMRYSAISMGLALGIYAGLRAFEFEPALASKAGFVAFGALASMQALGSVFGAGALGPVLWQMAVITARSLSVAAPFAVWAAPEPGEGLALWHLAALVVLGLALLAVNFPVLRELTQIRDLRSATR